MSKKNREAVAGAMAERGTEVIGRYYSVYRATVLLNEDPMHLNRLKVYIPDIDAIDWALPKGIPGTEKAGARLFTLPRFNDIVYITFEDGNPSLPLWEYHGWGEQQIPGEFDDPDVCGIITPKGTCVILNDRTGELFLKSPTRMAIQAEGDEGVIINAEHIYLSSLDHVQVNKGDQGVIFINELTEKLNKLVKEVDDLRTKYNTHTHTGVTTGPGSSGPTATLATKPISQFNKKDYEDETFLH